jgi:hypothetical protein
MKAALFVAEVTAVASSKVSEVRTIGLPCAVSLGSQPHGISARDRISWPYHIAYTIANDKMD